MPIHQVVHIVDDDQAIRKSVGQLLTIEGFDVRTYASANEFIAAAPHDIAGCLVTDVRMPGMSGIELLSHVRECGFGLNVILLTGHADVPLAVQATKMGAVDVIEKPFRAQLLIDAVRNAVAETHRHPEENEKASEASERLAALTPREREVLDQLIMGHQNKIIAYKLGISYRTVEIHRGRIMKKTRAGSLSELVKLYLSAKT